MLCHVQQCQGSPTTKKTWPQTAALEVVNHGLGCEIKGGKVSVGKLAGASASQVPGSQLTPRGTVLLPRALVPYVACAETCTRLMELAHEAS